MEVGQRYYFLARIVFKRDNANKTANAPQKENYVIGLFQNSLRTASEVVKNTVSKSIALQT